MGGKGGDGWRAAVFASGPLTPLRQFPTSKVFQHERDLGLKPTFLKRSSDWDVIRNNQSASFIGPEARNRTPEPGGRQGLQSAQASSCN